jgi:NAD(P)-dependent dehydrogenase (short-subunit alcohol dehydrogenase family)
MSPHEGKDTAWLIPCHPATTSLPAPIRTAPADRPMDPKQSHPTPPFPEQEQAPPGREAAMQPLADHGEDTYIGHGRLTDRVALVTGADSGIGRAVAIAFSREGADILCSYLEEDDDAAETERLVEAAGRTCVTVAGDIGDRSHCRALVDRAVDELGRLDVLVNNAAFQMSYDSFLDIPPDELDFVFRTNILAMFHLCQAAVPHMRPGSTIINTTSIQAAQPSPQLLHYSATKGAISTFTKGLAQELAERGIRVNAVAPGPIWTPLVVMSFPAEKNAQFGADTPLGRPGQPGELAPLYVFLASEDSSYISGEVIGATGGRPLH